MSIKYDNNRCYKINFNLYTIGYDCHLNINTFGNFDELKKVINESYPDVDFSPYEEKYHKLLDELNDLVNSAGHFVYGRENNYFCICIISNEVIFSYYPYMMGNLIREKTELYKKYGDGYITTINSYGWNYKSLDSGTHRIDYYSISNNPNDRVYKIHVYKDKLILGNGEKDKPTIVCSNNYFLYNNGKKREK